MVRRKRMHGRKRRSPAKLSIMNPNADFEQSQANLAQIKEDSANQTGAFAPFKPTGEEATSYNPTRIQNNYRDQLRQASLAMRNKLKGSQEEGAHSHDDDGIQSKNLYKQQSQIFGSGSGGQTYSKLLEAAGGGIGGNKHSNPGNNWGRGGSIGGQGDQSYPGRTPFAKKSPSKKRGFKMNRK